MDFIDSVFELALSTLLQRLSKQEFDFLVSERIEPVQGFKPCFRPKTSTEATPRLVAEH
jgi:hypothetical protein